jgi:hypothetical protein
MHLVIRFDYLPCLPWDLTVWPDVFLSADNLPNYGITGPGR